MKRMQVLAGCLLALFATAAWGDAPAYTRARSVQFDIGPLLSFDAGSSCGRRVGFKLFDENRVEGVLEEVTSEVDKTYHAHGVLDGAHTGGTFSLDVADAVLTASISTPVLGDYQVVTLDDGTFELRQLAPVQAIAAALAEEACSPMFSLQDCGFELGDLTVAWGDGATGPLGEMIYTATEGQWNEVRYGTKALRFAARDTDDVWGVAQSVTAEAAGEYLIDLRLLLTDVPTTGSVSISVGEQIHTIDLSDLAWANYHYTYAFPATFTEESLTQTLRIDNPSLNGGDVLVDNVHFDFPIVDGGEGEGETEGDFEGNPECCDEAYTCPFSLDGASVVSPVTTTATGSGLIDWILACGGFTLSVEHNVENAVAVELRAGGIGQNGALIASQPATSNNITFYDSTLCPAVAGPYYIVVTS